MTTPNSEQTQAQAEAIEQFNADVDGLKRVSFTEDEWQLFCSVMRDLTWGRHDTWDKWKRIRQSVNERVGIK